MVFLSCPVSLNVNGIFYVCISLNGILMSPYNVSPYMSILYEVMLHFRVFQSKFFWITCLYINGICNDKNFKGYI